MARSSDTPSQVQRDRSRRDHGTQHTHQNPQDASRREIQRGTQRSETEVEHGQRRDEAGNATPDPGHSEHESGDAKRPYRRAGH